MRQQGRSSVHLLRVSNVKFDRDEEISGGSTAAGIPLHVVTTVSDCVSV